MDRITNQWAGHGVGWVESEAIYKALLRCPETRALHALLLHMILSYRGAAGRMNPSLDVLASRCWVSKSSVQRALADLRAWELIDWTSGGLRGDQRISNCYRIGMGLRDCLGQFVLGSHNTDHQEQDCSSGGQAASFSGGHAVDFSGGHNYDQRSSALEAVSESIHGEHGAASQRPYSSAPDFDDVIPEPYFRKLLADIKTWLGDRDVERDFGALRMLWRLTTGDAEEKYDQVKGALFTSAEYLRERDSDEPSKVAELFHGAAEYLKEGELPHWL